MLLELEENEPVPGYYNEEPKEYLWKDIEHCQYDFNEYILALHLHVFCKLRKIAPYYYLHDNENTKED